jgi:hypothetical protein
VAGRSSTPNFFSIFPRALLPSLAISPHSLPFGRSRETRVSQGYSRAKNKGLNFVPKCSTLWLCLLLKEKDKQKNNYEHIVNSGSTAIPVFLA